MAALTPGEYTGDIVTIPVLIGSSLTGTFTTVEFPDAFFLESSLSYTATAVLVSYTGLEVSTFAEGAHAIAVANALDDVIAWNRTHVTYSVDPEKGITFDVAPRSEDVLASLLPFNTEEEMTNALNQLHPAQLKGIAVAQESNAVQVRQAITTRMENEMDSRSCFFDKKDSCKKGSKPLAVWVSGIGEILSQQDTQNAYGPQVGYKNSMGGFVLGMDQNFASHFYLGAHGAYTHAHMKWKDQQGSGSINSGYVGLHSSFLSKWAYTNLSVTGAWNGYHAKRTISYPGVDLTAENNHTGRQLLSHIDTGLNFTMKGFTIRPFDSFDYVTQTENAYTENKAGEWDLNVKKDNAILLRNELGLQFASCFCIGSSKWTLSPKISWVREIRLKGGSSVSTLVGSEEWFSVTGFFPDRNLLSPGVVLSGFMLEDNLSFGLYYNGEYRHGYSSNNFGGQVRFSF